MDDLQRGLGKLEGRFDGLENSLGDIKQLLEGSAGKLDAVVQRVDGIEKTHARVTGFVAACSAIGGLAVAYIGKKLSVIV